MGEGQHGYKSHRMKSQLFGYVVAALILLALAWGVSRIVMLWCPRGVVAGRQAGILFWSGMLVVPPLPGWRHGRSRFH
jgi:hypothetical protein